MSDPDILWHTEQTFHLQDGLSMSGELLAREIRKQGVESLRSPRTSFQG
jgi:hypothetical protein